MAGLKVPIKLVGNVVPERVTIYANIVAVPIDYTKEVMSPQGPRGKSPKTAK